MKEPLLKDFNAAAEDIYNQILKKYTASKFLVYGHSMGANIALRVVNMLERDKKHPTCLVVSGSPGPLARDKTVTYSLGKKDFKKIVQSFGGFPDELMQNEELFDYFEPILRADFEIIETHEMVAEPPVTTPLYAIMGSSEDKVSRISNWASYTRSKFNYEILEGGHFFIYRHAIQIANIINRCYEQHVLCPVQ
jgi:surfactin synthase thioesterase subunit